MKTLPSLSFVATVGFGSVISGLCFFLGLVYYYGGLVWLLWVGLLSSWLVFYTCTRLTSQILEAKRMRATMSAVNDAVGRKEGGSGA